jgi:hypothetical protein
LAGATDSTGSGGGSDFGEADGSDRGASGARDGIAGGRGTAFFTGDGVAVGSPLEAAGSTPGGTGNLERTGGGGGSFERTGAGGGVLALAVPAVAAWLLRTGGGGGAERPLLERGAAAFGFLFDSPSSAIRELGA